MKTTETISHEAGNPEAWICLCGNHPSGDGFFPCDAKGNEVDPVPSEWTTNAYVCHKCGRIIDQHTLAVIGQKAK
ncbi:MAG: hypothetical protein EBS05_14745 [Proteobacteria bacterium]|nr:hypothetical protein [Pseudomonadota bacterium]